jgi:DNA-binding GntR family transcriptional regulator
MRKKASNGNSKDILAYEEIKKLFFGRKLPPGQKIIYRDLEETLGMSKTPIISALVRLEREGVVVSEQNRGYFVRQLTTEDVRQMYDLRERLEEIALDYALAKGTPQSLDCLKSALDAYISYTAQVYDAKRFKLDAEFHTAIARLGGNSFLVTALEQFYLTAWVSVNVVVFTPFIDRFKADHRALYRAIKQGDRKAAKIIMRRHERTAFSAVAASATDTVEDDD